MLTVATLWMLAYLWLVPNVVQDGENDYQTKMAYIEKPNEYRDAVTKAMAEIRAERTRLERVSPDKPGDE